jgi:hypothetical protein
MTTTDTITQVRAMLDLAESATGLAQHFTLRAAHELLGALVDETDPKPRRAKLRAVIPTELPSSPKAETGAPPAMAPVTCVACKRQVAREDAIENMVRGKLEGFLHKNAEDCAP